MLLSNKNEVVNGTQNVDESKMRCDDWKKLVLKLYTRLYLCGFLAGTKI